MVTKKFCTFLVVIAFLLICFCFHVLCKYYHKKIWRTLTYSYGIRLIKRLLNESSFGNVLRDLYTDILDLHLAKFIILLVLISIGMWMGMTNCSFSACPLWAY